MPHAIPRNESQLIAMRHGSLAQAWQTVKRAAGPTSNTQYERALSQIGMSILQDRASDLLPYLAGFQLLDRSDDGEFAAGFFVFDANGLIIDAPLFMLSGKVKGQQILFVRNSGVFVPSRDGVIRYLLSRQRQNIGEAGPQPGMPRPMRASPDISVFNASNRFLQKQASFLPGFSQWAKTAGLMDSIHSIYQNPETLGAVRSFREGSFGSGLLAMALELPGARGKLAAWCRQSPVVKARVESRLGPAEKWASARPVLDLRRSYQIVRKTADAPTYEDQVKLYTQPPTDAAGQTRDKMIGEILMFGFSPEDRRKASDMSKAVPLVDASGWASPSDSGIYQVADPEGDKHRSMVFISRDRFDNTSGTMLIIRTADSYLASVVDGDLATPSFEASSPSQTFKEIYDKLPEFSTGGLASDDSFLVFSPEGLVAGPYRVRHEAVDGVAIIDKVSPENQSDSSIDRARRYQYDPTRQIMQRDDYGSFEKTDLHGEPTLIVPKGARVLQLPTEDDGDDCSCGGVKEFRVLAISGIDLQRLNRRPSLKVARYTEKLVMVNDQPLTNRQAGYVLIKQAGLPADFVMDLLRSATDRPQRFAVVPADVDFEPWQLATKKEAYARAPLVPQNVADMQFDYPEPVTGTEPDYFQTPSQEVREDAIISPMSYGDPTSPRANPMYAGYDGPQVSGHHDPNKNSLSGNPGEDADLAKEIAASPEKLFENKIFLSLLRKSRIDSEISKYTEALFKLCDQTGRILFLIYAHADEFADFYGEKDVDTLEEQLLTMFESGGDLLAELLEQSVGTSDNITLASLDQAT